MISTAAVVPTACFTVFTLYVCTCTVVCVCVCIYHVCALCVSRSLRADLLWVGEGLSSR